jgi:hypothetical protein
MRRVAIIAMAVVGALVVPSVASAKTYIGCVPKYGATSDPKPRVAPRNCDTWYPWLAHYQAHNFQHLRWKHWGQHTATARGIDVYIGMGERIETPVRIRVWRKRGFDYGSFVDMPAYTRLKAYYRNGHTAKVNLPWGFDLWPDY